ncbi:MAG: CAP domain-containing protein, partial [Gammaproteobacteria bacterium]|nr:CAP domain-containing protein [Gammaproteobacteria bacterium]
FPVARTASRAAFAAPALATRALELVNDVRARGTRCGNHSFAPAPPMTLSGTLGGVAFGHAADMAQHGYFEHQDLSGQSPADRVRAVGYGEKLVGENIAYGPQTIEEVVQGWLDSPEHCENIMDPRFAEMGIASAAGRTARHGLYWVQVLAEPRA